MYLQLVNLRRTLFAYEIAYAVCSVLVQGSVAINYLLTKKL